MVAEQDNVALNITPIASRRSSVENRKSSLVQHHHVTESPMVNTGSPPPSQGKVLAYLIYMFMGIAVLYPWNAVLTSLDYLFQVYPGSNVDRVFSIIYFPSNLAILIICTIFMRVFKLTLRIVVGFMCLLLSIMMPILNNYAILHGSLTGTSTSLILLYVGAALAGMGDGWAQGATFSDASPLPPLYIQAVNVGSGLAGVLVFILRCITKASFGDDPVGLRNGAMVFYFLAVGIVLASLALYLFVLKKLPFVQFYRSRVQYHDKGEHNSSAKQYWALFKIRWRFHYASLLITYITTLFIFPGVLMSVTPPAALGSWYYVLVRCVYMALCVYRQNTITKPHTQITGVYNIFDALGKAIPCGHRWVTISSARWLFGLSLVRLVFIPLMVLFNKLDQGWVCLGADAVLALSNGYLTTNVMVLAARGLKAIEQEIVINSCVLCIISGLAMGSFLAFLWLLPAFHL